MQIDDLSRQTAATILLLLLWATPAQADWGFRRGGVEATNRQEVPANLAVAPGIASVFPSERHQLPTQRLFVDGNGDGSLDILMPFRGSLGLFDPAAGGFAWTSPDLGIDAVVGLGDFDGDGDDTEVLAASQDVEGGLFVIDLQSGSLLASITDLAEGTGVEGGETVRYDLDGDGRLEIVFAARTSGLTKLWVAGFEPDFAGYSLLELDFTGAANFTLPRVGRLFPDGGVGIALMQGAYYSLWSLCEPTEAEALCDPQTGELCFCGHGRTATVNPLPMFGAPEHAVDVDGDGDEELVEIMAQSPWGRAVKLFDFDRSFEGDEADGLAARVWVWDHAAHDPIVEANAPATDPVDLDGDGDLDVVVNFANNGTAEVDANGAPLDDGLDAVGGGGRGDLRRAHRRRAAHAARHLRLGDRGPRRRRPARADHLPRPGVGVR